MSLLSLNQLSSEHYAEAMFSLVAFGAAICLYYCVVQVVRDIKSFHFVLRVFMVTATSVGLISTLQTLFPPHTFLPGFFQYSARLKEYEGSLTEAARVYASFAGISPFGEFVSTSLVFHYILFRRSGSLAERLFWLGSAVLLTIGMLGSATRMALISLGVGAIYMLIMGGRVIPRVQLLRVFFVLFALVVLALPFMGSVTDLMTERLETLGPKDGSAQSRWGAMEQALEAIPDSPFLGHGLIIPIDTFRGGVTRIVHCLFIHIPYTIGIPGLIAFLWLMASQWRLSLRVMNDRNLPLDLREFTLAAHTTLVMFLLYQVTSDYIVDPMSTHLAWLRFGLLMALVRIAGRLKAGAAATPR